MYRNIMHLSVLVFLLYFDSLIFVNGRGNKQEINHLSGLSLLKSQRDNRRVSFGTYPSLKTWSFFNDSRETTLIELKKIYRRKSREISFEAVGYSKKLSYSTLVGIHLKHKKLPLAEVSLDILKRKVILRYLGDKSFQRVTLTFGSELVEWNVLSAVVNRTHFTVRLDCNVEKSVKLAQRLHKIPKKAVAVLGSSKTGEDPFIGELLQAKLYTYAIRNDQLLCAQPGSVLFGEEGYLGDEAINGDRILLLEQQITQLNKLVDSLKQQNANLSDRVAELDTCCDSGCEYQGQEIDEGDTWSPDTCTVCICSNNKPDCLRRTDIPSCQSPCETNPCMNYGQCFSFDETKPNNDIQCMCQPPYDGQYCEYKENPCVWPRESGICDQNLPRYYYDTDLQECLPFNYTGCGGNINNYESMVACEAVAVIGACCYRHYSLKVEDIIVSSQQESVGCKEISLSECQSTHRQVLGDTRYEVTSFYPGETCDNATCGRTDAVCMIEDKKYEVGEKAILGCQECTCESSGQFVCSCSQKAVRKEIRDMTSQELSQFQAAIQELRLVGPGNPWEELRDIYMRHTMHSNGGPYFLPWHRIFLRKLEQMLQEIDCSITLPYYDFTTDIGNFENAIIWQPNYFGGDGVDGCVVDHPFGPRGAWRPCISRKFNSDVNLPTLLELSLAIASDDYAEMSRCLESYVSYIHTYIGGDMATRAASYDPIFYSIHAYVDMLYWWWQKKGDNMFKYPPEFGNIPMVPFNIPPSAILDLENDLCVKYIWPSDGTPCDRTLDGDFSDNGNKDRGDVNPVGDNTFTGGFNSLGYDASGFDRRGYDKNGFQKNGYNRDSYDKDGYDVDGYNRYGYNRDGYNRYGYDIEGWDRDNMPDLTARYNAYGLDMNCLDRRGYTTTGLDRFGFNQQGYNSIKCNYYFNGPFATIQSKRIWNIMLVQSKTFLMSLQRTCPPLEHLPINWLQQYWITDIKNVTDMVQVAKSSSNVLNSKRFCFDIDDFVRACDCDVGIATCEENPCLKETCPSYPEASCHIDFCGVCRADWFVNGGKVDCFEERDFCQPNPCENGGTCVQSVWPSEAQLTTCICPPGFDGHYCQYKSLDICELPISTGNCGLQETRWYFDRETQSCQTFLYTGCTGNAQNFQTKDQCEARCRIGACCYRFPKDRDATIGYDSQGYDLYGFDVGGQNRRGDVRIESNGIKTGRDRFQPDRYDWQGYDRNGFDRDGYNRWGLDKSGYDREGYNLTGYNRQGEYDGITDYDGSGYDVEGYNRAGYTCQGSKRDGLNAYNVYSEYVYKCRPATLQQCQALEDDHTKIVKYTKGQRCSDVDCSEKCGCFHNNKMYEFGETWRAGCQFCTCTYTGAVECSCSQIYRRKEVRDMTGDEMKKYQNAIKSLSKTEFPSKWFQFSKLYADHKAQAVGNSASLPWHRQFLRTVEQALQETDCSITIPYYDWTLNAGDQQRARIWAADMFGGDGSDTSACIRYHPFKDYYPPYWVPCLRRRFNTSLPLPDVIDLQIAVNEPDYNKFRLHMELYLNMFASWGGGHMGSDHSPYDPLYLSVLAFVDRVWWDWQSKHPGSMLLYPQELRYIPMMPFKSSPDDVMDSKKQMCVTYYPLSEGAACNVTTPNLNYNSLGYDRHGFNREGYDIEGFNMFGVNRSGEKDDRGIYNIYDFDREGFKRNGYDSMGLDRYGFSVDNYNIDGYDSTGYDRTGYNRYGYNKEGYTPFGFNRNRSSNVDLSENGYDSYGFNRFGSDVYGFDHQGYDIFGFDTHGYDRNRCNRYFLGPMLVIVTSVAKLQLENLDDKTIRIITRICPALNYLPEWKYTVNWLRRGSQVPLIEGIVGRAQERAMGLRPDIRNSSVTSESQWLPVGPDRSLCFVTYHYTECPFGEPPVDCIVDLCKDRACPGYPDAVCRVNRCGSCNLEWYNGRSGTPVQCSGCIDRSGIERGEATEWAESDCETCACQDGLVSCREAVCPPVFCTHPVKIPGQCCLQCQDCDYDGIRLRNGQEYSPPDNRCDLCQCNLGNVNCRYVDCPDLGSCTSELTLDGECCPTCLDCGDRSNGAMWKEAACQDCTCVDGRVECERIRCIPPDCSHPRTVPGECCPSCDGCTVDGRDMFDGETYRPDQCTECNCRDGNVLCDPVPCPFIACLNPITPPGECCPRCDNECKYDNRRYRHEEIFLSTEDRCTNCSCENSVVRCSPVNCPRMDLRCRRPITLPGECCPSECPTCFAEGRDYETGERWTSLLDPCETCVCEEGITSCTRIERCPQECDHGIVRSGECCSDCRDCNYLGLRVSDGQSFLQPGDACQQCTCSQGQVTCVYLGPCPRLPCTVTETPPGACCPQCKVCEYRGDVFYHGDVVSTDPCSTCHCRDGEVMCTQVSCAPANCRSPVTPPGACCPICLECEHKGRTYQDGERFTPLLEPCHDCECRGGQVSCSSRENECPLTRCTHPIKSRGQCCPTCDGCSYLRRRLRNGQKFVPPGNDNCKVCRCRSGSVECNNMGCPAVNCDNAVLVKGQCCPVCPMGCNVMGIEYRDGQTFIDFMDRCKVCTCMMGRIRCMAMMSCPPVQCTHPANRPGNCCPSCTKCEVNNVLYRNGETFTNPADTCEDCSCRDGSVTCRRKSVSCPRVNCVDPVLDPNTCCPTCPARACTYAGRQYREGQEVPASQDRCEMCDCNQGMIDCKRRECPAVSCRHPGRNQCCDVCDFCMYNGMRIELGEMFPNPYDSCEECVCKAGSVECDRKVCGIPNCRNLSYPPGACCPVCSDCTFQGFVYKDGEDFQNPSRPCERCLCMQGKVGCDTRRCAQVSCRNPVFVDCCPVCSDCLYLRTRYQNGERFLGQDGCGQCECNNGDVKCEDTLLCPPVTCSHPVTTNCCKHCTDCEYKGNLIQDGSQFGDNDEACKTCVCQNGSVFCHQFPCQPVTCRNPVQGRCCLECTDCDNYGMVVKNGSAVKSVMQDCEICQCIMGNLDCHPKSCSTPSCSHPVVDECCPVCEQCYFNGRTYNNLAMFVNEIDSCQQCVCEYGSVICSDFCVADRCNHGNRSYEDGETFSSISDQCQECVCDGGRTRCYQLPCPTTICSHPVVTDCCPQCMDCDDGGVVRRNGELFRKGCLDCTCLDGNITCSPITCDVCMDTERQDCCLSCDTSCIYQGIKYKDWDIVPRSTVTCEQCVCQRGEVRCDDIVCPRCSNGQREVGVPGQCCPRCENPKQNTCIHDGEYVQEGHTWNVDECTRCVCRDGVVTCTGQQCPPLDCDSNNVPISMPGTCCPVCVPKPATCIVYGDPHYRTFDGSTIHFQGTCKYVMSSDCKNKDFIVEVQHDNRGLEDVSWAQNFTIKIEGFHVDLLQNLVVQINGQIVRLPYNAGTRLSIEKHNNNVLVNTGIGLQFVWDGSSRAELSVPGQYKRRTCGLCGNFNGYPNDDLRTESGEITSSMSLFGNSWKTGDQTADTCVDGQDIDPCVVRGFRARRQAQTLCEMIRSPWFSACHGVISFEPYYASCVYDVCACVNQTACLCDILATYASECAKLGVRLQWRSHSFCAMDCDTDKGFVFDDCGPVCHRSCDNWQTRLGHVTENCKKPCVAGCQCTADKVVHQGECIPINQCPNYKTLT